MQILGYSKVLGWLQYSSPTHFTIIQQKSTYQEQNYKVHEIRRHLDKTREKLLQRRKFDRRNSTQEN